MCLCRNPLAGIEFLYVRNNMRLNGLGSQDDMKVFVLKSLKSIATAEK